MRVKDKLQLNASSMKQRIAIMRDAERTQNEITGKWTEGQPTTLCEAWASVNNLYGQEYWSAREAQAENTLAFTVFYAGVLETLNERDYIVWDGKTYDIKFADNIQHENEIVKIRAVIRS